MFHVYIISNFERTVFYIGVTNNLPRRLFEHKKELVEGFSKRYKLRYLVYLEETKDVNAALEREKQLKRWHRDWKLTLIKQTNPTLEDLDPETSSG